MSNRLAIASAIDMDCMGCVPGQSSVHPGMHDNRHVPGHTAAHRHAAAASSVIIVPVRPRHAPQLLRTQIITQQHTAPVAAGPSTQAQQLPLAAAAPASSPAALLQPLPACSSFAHATQPFLAMVRVPPGAEPGA